MQELGNEGGRNFVSENIWVAHWIVPFSSSGSFKMFLFSRVPLILLISWAQHPKLIFFLFFCWLTVLTSMMPLSFREQCWEAVKKPLLFKQFIKCNNDLLKAQYELGKAGLNIWCNRVTIKLRLRKHKALKRGSSAENTETVRSFGVGTTVWLALMVPEGFIIWYQRTIIGTHKVASLTRKTIHYNHCTLFKEAGRSTVLFMKVINN